MYGVQGSGALQELLHHADDDVHDLEKQIRLACWVACRIVIPFAYWLPNPVTIVVVVPFSDNISTQGGLGHRRAGHEDVMKLFDDKVLKLLASILHT